ncbi:SET domain-containing protein [Heracleum sosnowskyi]|uniref:SET domain-containing protein n=1 Tax=Heracleum sosnowskyi TaxID=360622 RepID=A0AAD8I0K4_9APIA|nr:SET domain-containing protein [Heracleum sosnowskyi]
MENEEDEKMQLLRSKATDLLLREEWKESIQAYSQFISLCHHHISNTRNRMDTDRVSRLRKSMCLAYSNQAEARFRLRDFNQGLKDCDEALKIEDAHFKTLLCKGKILINLDRYNLALQCFKIAVLDPQASVNSEMLNGYLEKCKKMESLLRTGGFDFSDWILSGFRGKLPELAEYIGPVEIKKSEISGRGLFATKNLDSGSLLLVTKAVAVERGILPQSDIDNSGQLVMWKNLVDKVVDSAGKCNRTYHIICKLSNGEEEESLEVPGIDMFRPDADESLFSDEKVDKGRLLSILDVNSLTEDMISTKVLGKSSNDYYGVGLWVLSSFINHSCYPNAKRFHIGDYVIVHISRDVKAGEELTFGYFDVFSPLCNRKKMASSWGFDCNCKRCKFEEGLCSKQEMKEMEIGIERGLDLGGVVYKLEECMRRWMVRGRAKGHLRASFWVAYSEVFGSEKLMRKWGRRIPAMEALLESIVDGVGSDGRILKVFMEGIKRNGNGGSGGVVEMEKAMKLGRGAYGKVMKKQAMKSILELITQS